MTFRQDANQLWVGVKGACFAKVHFRMFKIFPNTFLPQKQFKPEEFATEYQQMERECQSFLK